MAQQNATPTKYIQSNYSIKGVAELSLFDSIDTKKTADNVRDFFKNDFPRIKRMAHASSDLKSPTFSDLPKGDTVGNTNEEGIIKRIWAKKLTDDVYRAVRACDHQSQVIIKHDAIQGKSKLDVQQEIEYEHTQYYKKQCKAYNQFADAFEVQDKGIDLHDYRENEKRINTGLIPD